MWKITKILKSSIFVKVTMALSGLFLISFTMAHLLGNFTLLVPEKGKFTGETFLDYSESQEKVPLINLIGTLILGKGKFTGVSFLNYAKTLHRVPLLRFIEIMLFVFFIIHITTGLSIIVQNYRARPVKYKMQKGKGRSTLSSRTMPYTGVLILFFLVLHLNHFSFSGKKMGHEMFQEVIKVFHNPIYLGYYIVLVLLLGFHIHHGFQSAFQTFGWHHNKYNYLIRIFGKVLALFISFGFATIPIVVYLFYDGVG